MTSRSANSPAFGFRDRTGELASQNLEFQDIGFLLATQDVQCPPPRARRARSQRHA